MAPGISNDTLNKETDARFWATTGYKPGQSLDLNNPMDKAYGPVWKEIFRQVKREGDAGTLVTTFDHPVVAQHLADAEVANKAAAAHLDLAATAPDGQTSQENVVAATTAAQLSSQKAREAAALQPPAVSPKLVQEAGKKAVKTPPPPQAASGEHIAHERALAHAREMLAPISPPREVLYKETNVRFWNQTHYKPGQNLDMRDARDQEMAKSWRAILKQVQHEADTGSLVFSRPEWGAPRQPPQASPPPVPRPLPAPQRPPVSVPPSMSPPPMGPPMGYPRDPRPSMGYPRGPMRPMYPRGPMGPMGPMYPRGPMGSMYPRGPMGPMGPMPSGAPTAPLPPGTSPTGGASLPAGMPGPGTPTEGGAPPSSPPSSEAGPPPGADSPPPPPDSSSIGKYLALGAAVIAGGGLLYYATTRTSRSPSRARAAKVILATPARAASGRVLPTRPSVGP